MRLDCVGEEVSVARAVGVSEDDKTDSVAHNGLIGTRLPEDTSLFLILVKHYRGNAGLFFF